MKTAVICLIGLVGSWGPAAAESLVEGRVRLDSGSPVPGARVLLFDLSDLRAAPIGATTDQSGHFTLSLGTLPGAPRPERFELGSNYPNPFNPSTLIPYQLPSSMHVRLEVFNLLGQRLATLVDGEQPAGPHTAEWDATDAAGQAVGAGVYLYRLSGAAGTITRRMLLVDGQAGSASAGAATAAWDEAGPGGETALAYGLTVSGPGLVPYVDPAFRVTADMPPLDVVVETPSGAPGAKAASGGILGDVDNTGRVDFLDALLVALYSRDSSIVMPNSGDISLGDVNADGQVDLSDLWVIAAYLDDPTDPTLPAGIGESVGPPVEAEIAPDLVVDALTLSDSTAIVGLTPPGGGTFQRRLAFTVRNQGSGASKRTWLRVYGSTDKTIATSDTGRVLVFCNVDGLSASESRPGNCGVDVPSAAGTYYYWVCVPAVPGEADTTNNCSAAVTLTAGNPDLVVDSLTVSDSSPISGTTFTLSATVRNRGSVSPAGSPLLRYYRSTDATITTDDTTLHFYFYSAGTRDSSSTFGISAPGPSSTTTHSWDSTAPVTPGTYYYGACVDPESGERDTTNNCSKGVRVDVAGAPDLVVDTPTVSNSSPDAGASFTLSATVRNQGHGASSANTLRYYWSDDSTISTSDSQVGYDDVSGLGASGTSAESITLTANADPGTHYLGACMDSVPNEANISNNCSAAVAITVVSVPAPDLVADTPTTTISHPTAGTSFRMVVAVRNQGDSESDPATLRFYRSADSTITTSDERIDFADVSGLSPNETAYLYSDPRAPSTPGTYYYGACVVSVTGESNTGNNCSPGIEIVAVDQPDLVVEAPWTSHWTPDATSLIDTSHIDFHVVVRNQGAGPVQGFPAVRFDVFVSTDSTIGVGDTQEKSFLWRHGNLSSGSEEGVTASFHTPSTAGEYHYYACVELVEGESDTTNNCSEAVKVTVEAADLMILLPTVSSNSTTAGASFTLRATVLNRGGLGSDAITHIRYFRSTDATVTATDTPVGADLIGYLNAHETSEESISVTAPSTAGTYYYGACVDAVSGESDTTNNCSEAVEVTVGERPLRLRLTSCFVFQEQHFVRFEVTANVPLSSVAVHTYQVEGRNNKLHLMETTNVGDLSAGDSYEKLTSRLFPAHLRRHLTTCTASVEWGHETVRPDFTPDQTTVSDLPPPPPPTYTPPAYGAAQRPSVPNERQVWSLWISFQDTSNPTYRHYLNCGTSGTGIPPCPFHDHIAYWSSLPSPLQRCAFEDCDFIQGGNVGE